MDAWRERLNVRLTISQLYSPRQVTAIVYLAADRQTPSTTRLQKLVL